MVLLRFDGEEDNTRVVLQDPNADEDALLVIDRLASRASGPAKLCLSNVNYEIADETQPFSFGCITSLIFRERRIVRDVAICALILGLLALSPIIFFRLLSDKVLFYKAYNTFSVFALAMLFLIAV